MTRETTLMTPKKGGHRLRSNAISYPSSTTAVKEASKKYQKIEKLGDQRISILNPLRTVPQELKRTDKERSQEVSKVTIVACTPELKDSGLDEPAIRELVPRFSVDWYRDLRIYKTKCMIGDKKALLEFDPSLVTSEPPTLLVVVKANSNILRIPFHHLVLTANSAHRGIPLPETQINRPGLRIVPTLTLDKLGISSIYLDLIRPIQKYLYTKSITGLITLLFPPEFSTDIPVGWADDHAIAAFSELLAEKLTMATDWWSLTDRILALWTYMHAFKIVDMNMFDAVSRVWKVYITVYNRNFNQGDIRMGELV